MKTMFRFAVCSYALTLFASPYAYGARFLPLGFLSEEDGFSHGQGISANGATIVGESDNKAYRWTEAEGMVPLEGHLPDGVIAKDALGVSGDGNLVFGSLSSGFYLWTQASGFQSISAAPSSVSFDGSMFVGLPDTDISADGNISVGSEFHVIGREGYRDYINDSGCTIRQWLGELPGGEYGSIPLAVSADGRVVVGQSKTIYDDMGTIYEIERSFLWTEELSMIALDPWPNSSANDVSANGLVVIGSGLPAFGMDWEAFRWTPATGMVSIRELLLDEGIDVAAMGWTLDGVKSLSTNGHIIAGTGINPSGLPEALLIELPVPGDFDEDGDSDGNDFLAWQRGESHDPFSASDLADWQVNFAFFSNAAEVSASAVPEPGALLLGLMCMAMVCVSRRSLTRETHEER